MRPMLAVTADHVPRGEAWVHEVKWDGMRVLAEVHDGHLTLRSRTERDVTTAYPELAGLADLYDDLLLDGEVVALRDGVPSFAALADRMHVTSARRAEQLAAAAPVTFMAFDLLRVLGQDITTQPWSARRALLEQLDIDTARWQVPPVFDDGEQLLAATAEQGLEGIVSKRRDAPYVAARRSSDWQKMPHRRTTSVVVGGWRPETSGADRLGAVLVGVPGPQGLHFAGRVGSGLGGRAGDRLRELLDPLAATGSPFAEELPRIDARGARWVTPRVVVDVASLGHTDGGRLRQPAFQRVRPDLDPEDLDA
ncbi:non-homologous end-joining DNA ligase [Janibacter melonis]|uniref:non-homologous end-joining DNA ligase n=1 Tax=Janibacter melonis TaxID=262209 RepID=UPI00191A3B8C|nr:non-homologous end-joining DNA ligase [Janibacter melonis]